MALIRAGGAEDLAEIAAVQRACPEAAQWNPEDYLGYDLRVAMAGERVAGFAVTRVTSPGEIELLNLAVAPAFRRRGLGRRLLENVLRTLKTEPKISVFLEVRESNERARNFYKSLNFRELGIRQNYYQNPSEAAIVMKFHSC